MKNSIFWFRTDLRLKDNPALKAAAKRGRIVPVFIWSPEEEGEWPLGEASRWWLHRSLESLGNSLRKRGVPLLIARGPAARTLAKIARETKASALFFTRRCEPCPRAQEEDVSSLMERRNIQVNAFPCGTLFEPESIRSQSGSFYKVFTAYWNRCGHAAPPLPPCGDPGPLRGAETTRCIDSLDSLCLLPKRDWSIGLEETHTPGEKGAHRDLKRFLSRAEMYSVHRDFPSLEATSLLSPRLRFGEIDVRRVWAETSSRSEAPSEKGSFLRELGWREFSRHILFHEPHTPEYPHDRRFERFRWRRDDDALRAWQEGLTGYPIVDAGMRQLWRTGFMHNRVRMITASFLTKDLLIDWREGARWFWKTLVDADLANNTLGWQWCAGCGVDAAPFFRIFNPLEQGRRYDPEGAYVRRWVPELSRLETKWIHSPWTAPENILREAGVALGSNYPAPIVDHAKARIRALAVFRKLP